MKSDLIGVVHVCIEIYTDSFLYQICPLQSSQISAKIVFQSISWHIEKSVAKAPVH